MSRQKTNSNDSHQSSGDRRQEDEQDRGWKRHLRRLWDDKEALRLLVAVTTLVAAVLKFSAAVINHPDAVHFLAALLPPLS